MTNMFYRNNDFYKYVTHHAKLLHVQISKPNKRIRHRDVKLWNYMVKKMDCNYAFVAYKCHLKRLSSSLNNNSTLDN